MSIPAYPKPSQTQQLTEPVRVYRDGRERCENNKAGKQEYRRRRKLAWRIYLCLCVLCGKPVAEVEVTADHVEPRGTGSGWRDDRLINMVPAHGICNRRKGSQRDVEGVYERRVAFLTAALVKQDYLTDEEEAIAREVLDYLVGDGRLW